MPVHRGSCHCGNVAVELRTEHAVADLPLRACDCSFCRKHGVVATSDPAGALRISIRDEVCLRRYRFGHHTADYLLCNNCGVYVAAALADGPTSCATLNANVLDDRAALGDVTSVSYEGETAETRIARRLQAWTPAEVVVGIPTAPG